MQDLPPPDKSIWPSPPVPWKEEIHQVEVATPDGLKKIEVTHRVNSIGMKFIRVEPGTFLMGLNDRWQRQLEADHQLGHQVTLTKPYYLGVFEVLNKEYELFDPDRKNQRPFYQQPSRKVRELENHPVEPLFWRDAQRFCRWLSEKEGRLYRLPTEAEWEYACKAGTETRVYWGDNVWDRNKANIGGLKKDLETWAEDGFTYTAPAGVYPANPWGFYDMIGNAWEWVNDWYEPYPTEAQVDPQGPPNQGHFRVAKGGGWNIRTRHLKYSVRDGNNPADIGDTRGFRVLCEVLPEEMAK
jgi:formylglycine-generating enzyme required for sulfatase activity